MSVADLPYLALRHQSPEREAVRARRIRADGLSFGV
jgi:hypothetical protein